MPNTLYWHDYETFGIDPARDRPSQFAGVRTDEDLNIIGEPLMIYCQPSHDILPAPEACLITGITPQKAQREGLPEPEFIAAIEREMAQPGTCSVGYNSLRFDDEMTRYALYRNFYDPYEREWKHGNSRWDIIDMMRLARALRPDGIEWPDYDDGSPSFRLEHLCAANNLTHEAAHDALSDVLATIALARLIKERQPRLYQYVYAHRSKHKVAELIDPSRRQPFLHVSQRLPRENGYTGLMMSLARHPVNSNAVIAVNLSADPTPLLTLPTEDIRARLFTRHSALAPDQLPIPLKLVQANRCPVVATPRLLDDEAAQRLGISRELCEQHWQRLLTAEGLEEKLREVFSEPHSQSKVRDADQRLYDGFLNNADRALLPHVRQAAPEQLADAFLFEDRRYQELLFQYRARHYPHTLDEQEALQWREFCFHRLTEPGRGFLTIAQFFERIESLELEHAQHPRNLSILKALRLWGQHIAGG